MNRIAQGFVIAFILTFGKSKSSPVIGTKQLHPVHGLYVQPSADGTTGDLYVAASEDSGTQTQWLTDQPISFLPVGAATQQISTTLPLSSSSGLLTQGKDESQTMQKRAIIASPPVQYAYALPFAGAAEGALSYPYAIPAMTTTATQPTASSESSPIPRCAEGTTPVIPYNPFQFYYPQMMTAYSNAKSILKESGMNNDSAGAVISQAAPMWSPYSAYPMYVMVDASAWTQAQAPQPAQSVQSAETSSTSTTTHKES